MPYLGHMDTNFYRRHTDDDVIKAKMWSMLLPPENPKAVEQVLDKMASSEESIQRFALVETVQFKNFIHTDESLRLTALLFLSLTEISFEGDLITIDGIRHIATSCNKLKHIEFYKFLEIDVPSACRLFNTEEHKEDLERIFIYSNHSSGNMYQLFTEKDLPFMTLRERCGLFFNKLKNEKEMLCLYHPGEYTGYGHRYSSYSCCGSMTPSYPSSLGCKYTYHQKSEDLSFFNRCYFNDLHDGIPEYMFQKYEREMFPLIFTERRQLHGFY